MKNIYNLSVVSERFGVKVVSKVLYV